MTIIVWSGYNVCMPKYKNKRVKRNVCVESIFGSEYLCWPSTNAIINKPWLVYQEFKITNYACFFLGGLLEFKYQFNEKLLEFLLIRNILNWMLGWCLRRNALQVFRLSSVYYKLARVKTNTFRLNDKKW